MVFCEFRHISSISFSYSFILFPICLKRAYACMYVIKTDYIYEDITGTTDKFI